MINFIGFVLIFVGAYWTVMVYGCALYLIRTPVGPKIGWKMALALGLAIISFFWGFNMILS